MIRWQMCFFTDTSSHMSKLSFFARCCNTQNYLKCFFFLETCYCRLSHRKYSIYNWLVSTVHIYDRKRIIKTVYSPISRRETNSLDIKFNSMRHKIQNMASWPSGLQYMIEFNPLIFSSSLCICNWPIHGKCHHLTSLMGSPFSVRSIF